MYEDLQGKVAIVTGGAGGIGGAYSRALAEHGVSVVVADLNGEGADAAALKLGSDGLTAVGVKADVTDPASARAIVDRAVESFGGLDILVNNAGIMSAIPKGKLTEIAPEAWLEAMRINALSVLVCTQAAVPAMRARGGGKIINQSSTAAFEPGGLYRLSKNAVVALTAALAHELGRENFNVNSIAPGMIQTEEGFRSAGAVGSDRRTARAKGVPNVRPDREPDALVGALLLLASDAGDYINGQTVIIDGGRNTRL
jgi:NAD(P)-dependent dehydrogenase (short-subunit alcohol dehydrogenase family)